MFKKIFNGQSKTIASAAIIIGATSLLSRLLGILRDRVLAGEFGAGSDLDMYYAAFRFPDLLFNLIIIGAISAGFIPVFTSYLKNEKKAWELVNNVLNILLVVLVLISVVLIALAPWITKLVAPGFSHQQLVVTANLTRIMFLSPIFLGISAILGSVLQTHKRFFINSIAPILYNVGIIIGALFFVPALGIFGLAWGVVLGAFLHMAIQVPSIFYLGYHYQPILNITDKGFLQILKIMVPRIMGIVTSQLNFFVITIIGSTLTAGSITIFNLANNLQSFPLGIFAVSFAVAAFPTLALSVGNKKDFIKIISSTLRQILFFIIPMSALLIVLRAQIVRIVLGSGRFNWEDTVLTLQTLSLFAISLFAQAVILLLVRAFYALHDSKTPFFIGLFSNFSNIILSFMLTEQLGVAGLALAFSMATILNLVLLWLFLHYKLGNLDGDKIIMSVGKIMVATFMLALVAQATKYLTQPVLGTNTFLGVSLQGGLAAILGILMYILICWLLRSEELSHFIDSFKRKNIKAQKITPTLEAIENE